jgi:CspA family cold shock protein
MSAPVLWLDLLSDFRAMVVRNAVCFDSLQESAEMPQGKVKRLVADRGFGFIETDRGDDLFFHHSEVQGATIEELREGQIVEYEVGQGRKGPCATQIRAAASTA